MLVRGANGLVFNLSERLAETMVKAGAAVYVQRPRAIETAAVQPAERAVAPIFRRQVKRHAAR